MIKIVHIQQVKSTHILTVTGEVVIGQVYANDNHCFKVLGVAFIRDTKQSREKRMKNHELDIQIQTKDTLFIGETFE